MSRGNWRMFVLFTVFFIFLSNSVCPVCSKDQYVEPLLFGLKASIPYDMANLFNRFPFQGGLALILGLSIAGILFFGVISAPFGYMFGVPSEKYVLGDFALKHPEVDDPNYNPNVHRRISIDSPQFLMANPRSLPSSSFLLDYVRTVKGSPRTVFSDQSNTESEPCCQMFLHYFDVTMKYLDYWEPGFLQSWKHPLRVLRNRLGGNVGKEIVNTVASTLGSEYTPEFISSMFFMIPAKETDIRNSACQLRMVCHAHGVLQYFPTMLLKIYHKFSFGRPLFSKKLASIPEGYVDAMKIGMSNGTMCSEVYSGCADNLFTLTLKSYLSLLPDRRLINNMPRRKQKMYSHMNFLK